VASAKNGTADRGNKTRLFTGVKRDASRTMEVVNVIAANVTWMRMHQLEELEGSLGGQRETSS
jgi:hypothetical protein